MLVTLAQPKKLVLSDFKNEITNHWWSSENKSNNKECDMRILIIKNDIFELNCVNWTNGFLGSKCAYDLRIIDNIFELKAKNCGKTLDPGFIYGYLSETGSLFLLVRKNPITISAAALSEKDWIKFEQIKR
jgi:hypothetical protein